MDSYTLEYDMTQSLWVLRHDHSGRVVQAFLSRREATEGDTLRALIGQGLLRIRNADGSFEHELARYLAVNKIAPAMPRGAPVPQRAMHAQRVA